MQRFISELQRRKVLRVASAYVVSGWIVLQVALALQAAMALPPAFSTIILAALVVGFPISLGLSWFFEITPEGIKRTVAAGDGELIKPQTSDLILAGMLALVVVVALAQALIPRESAPGATSTTAKTENPDVDTPALGDKSIAVLPFANLSTDKDDAVFADGLTEEVLNILAQVRGMRVTSRTSSFAFKDKKLPVSEIAKHLGVRHVLEGSVRRDGDDVRITAQLIDTDTDSHVWSQTFERKLADVFAVQDDIARAIAGALNIELSVSAGSRGAPTQNLEAYRLYLRAREQANVLTKDTMLDGIDLLKQAIKLDPNFADAYAVMASLYTGLIYFDASNRAENTVKGDEAAKTALRLKPDLATAYAVLSSFALGRRDWEAAVENATKALQFEPSNSLALAMRGHSLLALGFLEKAHQSFEEMARVDPFFSLSTLRLQAMAVAEGDNETAVRLSTRFQSAKGLGGFFANITLALVAREEEHLDEAVKYTRLAIAAFPQHNPVAEPVSRAIKDPAWRGRAVIALRDEAAKDPTFEPAAYYALVGALDVALESMRARLKAKYAPTSNVSPFAWHLIARGEGANPKLKALLREMGLVDYWKKHGWPDRCRAKGEGDFECS